MCQITLRHVLINAQVVESVFERSPATIAGQLFDQHLRITPDTSGRPPKHVRLIAAAEPQHATDARRGMGTRESSCWRPLFTSHGERNRVGAPLGGDLSNTEGLTVDARLVDGH
jgi:hypothetical protein